MDSKLLKDFSSNPRKISNFNNIDIEQTTSDSVYNITNDEYNNEITLCSYDTVFIDCYGREIDSKDWNVLEGASKSQETIDNFENFNEPLKKSNTSKCNNKIVSSQINDIGGETFDRPKYSYTKLITMAIENSKTKALSLNEIYSWCQQNFHYYATTKNAWKNSLRHNLSINHCFKKVENPDFCGRGCLWMLDTQDKRSLKPNLNKSTKFISDKNLRFVSDKEDNIVPYRKNTIVPPKKSKLERSKKQRIRSKVNKNKLAKQIEIVIVEKSRDNWTDTRLDSSEDRHELLECHSVTSHTDYNDLQRSIVLRRSIFPIKTHWYSDCHVTPSPSMDHTYSLPELHKLRRNHLSSRHTFLSSMGYPSPFPKSSRDDIHPSYYRFNYSDESIPFITVEVGDTAESDGGDSDDAIVKFREKLS